MWSSEEDSPRRAGRAYEEDLKLRYLTPGAFTILPPDEQDTPPDSPPVINNYKLTPTTRHNRNAAFSIVAETCSNPGSRTPSPTGRVSPFRGRGFNPIGSRHASPIPSPPPEERRSPFYQPTSTNRTKIPTSSTRRSNERLYPVQTPSRTNLTRQFSKSLTNVSPKHVTHKPPASPRRNANHTKASAFKKLSPIVGSSPERTPESGRINVRTPPSKIPRSRSQPPNNRLADDTSQSSSKDNSGNNSRSASRDPSPSRINTKDKYRNVKAKVNSFNKPKPKVPPKPQVPMPKLDNKDGKSEADNNSYKSTTKNSRNVKANQKERDKIDLEAIEKDTAPDKSSKRTSPKRVELKKIDSSLKLVDSMSPSATTVVSSTTTTAVKPLNIETNFVLDSKKFDNGDDSMHLPDVRTLSATSVSTAINRMNDTVLDTRTLMKGVVPAGSADNGGEIGKNVAAAGLSGTSDRLAENDHGNQFSLNVGNGDNTDGGSIKSMSNGRTSGLAPHDSVVGINVMSKSANNRVKDGRTDVVETGVQPIRINVKEKPLNADVQSGNVRLSPSAANGVAERPGLPPPHSPHEDVATTTDPPKGICSRLFGRWKKQPEETKGDHKRKRRWCFGNEEADDKAKVSSNENTRWWQCCKRKKIGDVENVPDSQRKGSWEDRTDSHITEVPHMSTKDRCKNFLRTIFCINLCTRRRKRKEMEEAMKRRASIMSKKKSLTPAATTVVEETTPKLDAGLVEHTSVMKAAIPVLPVPLAWFCLILNIFLPGFGTIFSGLFCLCMGKPRFSQKDGPKPRVGACIIDFFIGFGQLFTVLFCLVGWGWSIWWGVIMLKIAKKYRKIRRAEKAMEEDMRNAPSLNHLDVERGS
ncbi:hypothetical protein FQA39_LY17879 [Lamprigera yunnana]|nr:hypothetical protein FQA39_LY17879 [Lamprigera yunnana]